MGFAGAGAALTGAGAARGAGIWKDGGAYVEVSKMPRVDTCCFASVTVSRPLPLNALSVVAATFPPFRCRSQAMSLLFSCGSISAT